MEELNIKIAKKLGWKKFRKERTPAPLNDLRMTGVAPGNFRHQFVPNYATNLAYALKCVDWAIDHGYEFILTRSLGDKEVYEAQFVSDVKASLYKETGTLASIAICLAFVRIK